MVILIPAYEPSARLVDVVQGLKTQAPEMIIIVIDDGSGSTYSRYFEATMIAGAQLLTHSHNRGKGAAIKTGLRYVMEHFAGTGVVTADSDGQHRVDDIIAVAHAIETDTLILGCRDFSGEVPLRSRFGNTMSRTLFSFASGFSLSDTQTGLRGIPAHLIPWLLTVPGERFEWEQNVLLRCRSTQTSIKEVGIETVYLNNNESSHFRPVIDSARVILPVLFFAGSGFLSFIIDTIVFMLLAYGTGRITASLLVARMLSGTFNFIINKRLFTDHNRCGSQAIKYIALAIVLVFGSIGLIHVFTYFGLPLLIAKVSADGILFLLSYYLQRRLVFPAHKTRVFSAASRNSLTKA